MKRLLFSAFARGVILVTLLLPASGLLAAPEPVATLTLPVPR